MAPDRLEKRFEQPVTPQSRPPVEFPAPEQSPPPDKAGAIRFTLAGIAVDGATVFTAEDLRPLYQALQGTEISLAEIYAVRDKITAKYGAAGYVLSKAVIPAQHIADGTVHITVIEGYINEVRFEGAVSDRTGVLQAYAEQIKASRPLRGDVLDRYVMLANDLPGVAIHTVIQPAKDNAVGSDLVVTLESKPVSAGVTLDNRGTRSIGPYQITSSFDLNNLLGLFDQTTVRGIVTPQVDELRYLDVSHTELIGDDGATWTVGGLGDWSEPGADIRQHDIKSRAMTVRTGLGYPLIRSRSETLRLTTDVTYRNSVTFAQGSKLSDDRIRFLSVGASYDIADSWQGSNLVQVKFSRGFDVLNATSRDKPGQTRADAQPDYNKLTFSAQRVQALFDQFSLLVGVDGQFSPDVLTSSEEYGVGGQIYGRAFDSSEITGDKGAAAKIELQYTPDLDVPHLTYVQFFIYGDCGRVWSYEPSDVSGIQSLASTGGGLRFGLTDSVSGSVEFGKPFVRNTTATNSRDMRGFFSLSARY